MKVTIQNITSGYSSVAQLNSNFQALQTALENTLSRDGTTPNTMSSNLDMNGYRILNEFASTGEGFIWESAWITATAYSINNLVSSNGSTYICVEAHTSGIFATDLAAGKWELLASKGASGAGSGDLVAANNLSDVSDTTTARTNLGAQAADALLTALAAQTTAANKIQAYSGIDTTTLLDFKDEDNMASNSATAIPSQQSVKAYVDAEVSAATGKLVQVVEATPYTTWTSINNPIPIDDTIPQNTEGDQFVTASITPTSATNRLYIEAICEMVNAGSNLDCSMALFQDSTAGALAAATKQLGGSGVYSQIVLAYEMAAGTTSATTFKIRIGPGSGTIYVNGNASNRIFGGVSAVRLRVSEISV